MAESLVKKIKRGYRTLNMKTISRESIEVFAQWAEDYNARCAYCLHTPGGGLVDHLHLVAQFTQPLHLAKDLKRIVESDPHSYFRPCRSFKSSYRYLAHLDNPEKEWIDPKRIVRLGDWDGVPLHVWHAPRLLQPTMFDVHAMFQRFHEEDWKNRITIALAIEREGYNGASVMRYLATYGLQPEDFHDGSSFEMTDADARLVLRRPQSVAVSSNVLPSNVLANCTVSLDCRPISVM